MDTCFRPFSRQDGPAVAQLIHQLYIEDPGGRTPSGLQIQRTFEELTQHPDKGMILVFEHENDVIGYTILINYWSNEYGGNILHVDELFILPEFRGKGIASDFIQYLAAQRFNNAVAIQLEVTPNNDKAIKLYQKLGFTQYKNNLLFLNLGD